MQESKRNAALDIVRIIATFCVISFHFIASIGFTDVYMVGIRMYILCIMRSAFSVCVPLFLLLTGYLMRKKKWSGRFYLGIVKTLSIYTMASVLCHFLEEGRLGWDFLRSLIFGSGTGYSWYIRMYTGLFLLIPFLNMMYRGDLSIQEEAGNRKYRKALIGTLLYLTALPGVLNIFVFSWEWWKNPSISTKYVELISNFWTQCYPITYYMIGCYLAEYGLKMRRKTCALLLLAVALAKGSFEFYRADGLEYVFGSWQEYGSLFQVIQAVLAFNLIATIDTHGYSDGVKKLLKITSDWCLGAYLVSEIFEELFYPVLIENVASVGLRLNYYPVMAVTVFVCSLLLSGILNLLYDSLRSAVVKIKVK